MPLAPLRPGPGLNPASQPALNPEQAGSHPQPRTPPPTSAGRPRHPAREDPGAPDAVQWPNRTQPPQSHRHHWVHQQGHRIQSVTSRPGRHNPFGDQAPLHPSDSDRPELLAETPRDTDTLFNTHWIRINHRGRTNQPCVDQTRVMFQAAREAGVRRIIHVSITNADPGSNLPYFQGKGQVEEALRNLQGVSHAILRPTVLYSAEDIPLNNIAWTLRKFPAVFLPGRGDHGIQPVFVEDLAQLAVSHAQGDDNVQVAAVRPDVFSYADMVRLIREKTGAKCAVLPMWKPATYAAGTMLGLLLGDIVLTMDEVRGLSRGLLVSNSEEQAPCPTRLLEWLDRNAAQFGRSYANEVKRHYQQPKAPPGHPRSPTHAIRNPTWGPGGGQPDHTHPAADRHPSQGIHPRCGQPPYEHAGFPQSREDAPWHVTGPPADKALPPHPRGSTGRTSPPSAQVTVKTGYARRGRKPAGQHDEGPFNGNPAEPVELRAGENIKLDRTRPRDDAIKAAGARPGSQGDRASPTRPGSCSRRPRPPGGAA